MSHAAWDLDPDRRGEFFRQLQQLTTRIHATSNIDEIMLDLSADVCTLFGADRLTIYAVDDDKAHLVSKVKTGMSSFRQLKLPISAQSVAGYAALSRKLLNLNDVYDAAELQRYAPELRFQQGVDRRTGYRTREMLVIPLLLADEMSEVSGVFQLINNHLGGVFGATIVEGARYLCDTLAVAFAQRQAAAPRERAGFVGAVRGGVLGQARIDEALQQARASGRDIEDVLLDEFDLKLAVVGRALADHYSVPYLGYHGERRVPADLLAATDRMLALSEQWLPVGRSNAGLYVVCVDPERVRDGAGLAARFPDVRAIFCVTTRREFGLMVDQYFGPLPEEAAPAQPTPPALAPAQEAQLLDSVAALIAGPLAGAHRQGLSGLRIETAPGERPGEIRFTVSGVLRLSDSIQ
jgi:hypothetical protein